MRATVIGAGVSGLAAAMTSGARVYEQSDGPGGICRSYYLRPGDDTVYGHAPPDDDAYRFEVGGGHWIFGGDPEVLALLDELAPTASYERRAVVRIGGTTVPYPLQDHLDYLDPDVARRIVAEREAPTVDFPDEPTLQAWLEGTFGPTLSQLFFTPFNHRYTAGLSSMVAAQDGYKSPPAGVTSAAGPVRAGYNAEFRYPVGGLDTLAGAMAGRCDIHYGKQVTAIDTAGRFLRFGDGTEDAYEQLVSTLPLDQAVHLAGIELDERPDPHTSVLVLNIGAERGPNCPDAHWQYEPASESGFHRLGFYDNVDDSFLPRRHRSAGSHVGIYVERAFVGGSPPSPAESDRYRDAAVGELRQRGYIGTVDVLDPSWVEAAYTWRSPGSTWRERAMEALADHGVHQVGRYGTWHFQGIADSIRDGLAIGGQLGAGTLGAGSSTSS